MHKSHNATIEFTKNKKQTKNKKTFIAKTSQVRHRHIGEKRF